MKNPYYIDEPCVISFSGGRTSAYMLVQILEAHGGTLPPEHTVIFANTGKEMPETLDFVHRCERELSVPIVWVELDSISVEKQDDGKNKIHRKYKEVDYATAARNGEPFNKLIDGMPSIPNAVMRTCTVNLKIRGMVDISRKRGYESP